MKNDAINFFGKTIKREGMKNLLCFLIGANLMTAVFATHPLTRIINIVAVVFCSLGYYGYSRMK